MRVRVFLRGAAFFVEPDPVRVLIGEPLQWEFVSILDNRLIEWQLYFDHSKPFGPIMRRFGAQTGFAAHAPIGPIANPTHHGFSATVVAATAGDHKYGVRATDVQNQQKLADDDPMLIVVP